MKKLEHFYQNIIGYFTFPEFYTWIVNQLPSDKESHIVEVGVHSGKSAAYLATEIYNRNIPCKLDLVDYFTNGNVANRPTIMKQVMDSLEPVKTIIGNMHGCDSSDAASFYKDNSLDFVFIDASHEYEHVKKDIIKWKPKIKLGGIIAGHDFTPYIGEKGVFEAVLEEFDEWHIHRGIKFFGNDKREIELIGVHGKYFPCWYAYIK
jgi:predicted O-methyltransferase YrrM